MSADDPLLAQHVDAADVADDIDAIRAALGEERIAFFGNSYSTVSVRPTPPGTATV